MTVKELIEELEKIPQSHEKILWVETMTGLDTLSTVRVEGYETDFIILVPHTMDQR